MQGGANLTLVNILSVTFPATFLGMLAMSLYSLHRGKNLEDDPEYQRRLQDPTYRDQILNSTKTTLNDVIPQHSKNAVYIFLSSIVVIVILALYPEIRTFDVVKDGVAKATAVPMGVIIQMVMLCFGGIILTTCKTPVKLVPEGVVFKSGMVACVAIFGIAWMGDTFFNGNIEFFKMHIEQIVTQYPFLFAVALFVMSVLLFSQAATVRTLYPLGIALGIHPMAMIAMFPAVNGYFFIPNYPTVVAAINFDRTGTTRIGKYVLNHSFQIPGFVATIVAIAVGYLIIMFM